MLEDGFREGSSEVRRVLVLALALALVSRSLDELDEVRDPST